MICYEPLLKLFDSPLFPFTISCWLKYIFLSVKLVSSIHEDYFTLLYSVNIDCSLSVHNNVQKFVHANEYIILSVRLYINSFDAPYHLRNDIQNEKRILLRSFVLLYDEYHMTCSKENQFKFRTHTIVTAEHKTESD